MVWITFLCVTTLLTTTLITFKTIQSMLFAVFACDLIVTAFTILFLFRVFKSHSVLQVILGNSGVIALSSNETIDIPAIATRIASITALVIILRRFEPN